MVDEREDELDTYEKFCNAIMTCGLRKKKAENLEQTAMDVGSINDHPLKQTRYNDDYWDSGKSNWWDQWQK